MESEKRYYSYFVPSSPLQMILRRVEESKISIMQLPFQLFTFYPTRVSLLRYVRQQLSLEHGKRNRSKLFVLGGILVVAFIVMKRRGIYRSLSAFPYLNLFQSASQLTNSSTKILRYEISRKAISTYGYIISLVCNLVNKFDSSFKASDTQQSDITSIQSLVRKRSEKILQFYRTIQDNPPVVLNLEETMYNQIQAIFDLLEVLLMQRKESQNEYTHPYNLKTTSVGHSKTEQRDKVFKPLESNNYNVQIDKENSPCNAYEKLNNAISLTERLTRDLAIE
ncbi:hypothetical protein GpartN1_g2952.t1 [Galdieria partita]|uniref:Uncharacterized protein n=1 Tax=Galdieria partita TaxID=83374 RepID=A0A9C7PWP5_9RHOD|nr:hypothetical protein GpartN1_g2952.t1 [Galdieria partita]